ncbi:hypothetical protein BDQ17DRAFT_1323739 [Cyathus striatus]|nr:hypothetical protein BDQ17DRAFT_1323739 [Cyathus striatus]
MYETGEPYFLFVAKFELEEAAVQSQAPHLQRCFSISYALSSHLYPHPEPHSRYNRPSNLCTTQDSTLEPDIMPDTTSPLTGQKAEHNSLMFTRLHFLGLVLATWLQNCVYCADCLEVVILLVYVVYTLLAGPGSSNSGDNGCGVSVPSKKIEAFGRRGNAVMDVWVSRSADYGE